MSRRRIRFGAGFCVHNEEDYIAYSLKAVYDFADVIALSVNVGTPWGGEVEPLDRTLDIVKAFPDPLGKIRLDAGEWRGQHEQRSANLDAIRREDVDYYFNVDADEIYDADDLVRIRRFVAWRPYAGQFRIRLRTYWKTNPFYRIEPPEPLRAYIISRVRESTRFVSIRRTNQRIRVTIPPTVAVCHHFSYARPSERILSKLRNMSPYEKMVPDWYENVWLGWDANPEMTNLHPTNPPEYERAVRAEPHELPEVMRSHPFAAPSGI